MKLIKIYNVVKDETFLVELIDKELTVRALKAVVQDRGKLITCIDFNSGEAPSLRSRFVFKNRELKSGRLPSAYFEDSKNSIHVIPYEINPLKRLDIQIEVQFLISLH